MYERGVKNLKFSFTSGKTGHASKNCIANFINSD